MAVTDRIWKKGQDIACYTNYPQAISPIFQAHTVPFSADRKVYEMDTKKKKQVAEEMSVPRKLSILQLVFDYSIGAITKKVFNRELDRLHLFPSENAYMTDLLMQML